MYPVPPPPTGALGAQTSFPGPTDSQVTDSLGGGSVTTPTLETRKLSF